MVSKAKAYVSILTTLLAVVAYALSDNVFNGSDIANVAAAIVTAAISGYAVYKTPRFVKGTRPYEQNAAEIQENDF